MTTVKTEEYQKFLITVIKEDQFGKFYYTLTPNDNPDKKVYISDLFSSEEPAIEHAKDFIYEHGSCIQY